MLCFCGRKMSNLCVFNSVACIILIFGVFACEAYSPRGNFFYPIDFYFFIYSLHANKHNIYT